VEQVLKVEEAGGERINNIVFMGMGEPLANYANLMRAIGVINAPWGVGLGARHITISTSGLAPQIRQLADQPLQVRLAISLHGATDEVRQQIMPVNRKYPLGVLLDACAYYVERKKQRLTFEYILIDGVNDSPEQAAALVQHARRLRRRSTVFHTMMWRGLTGSGRVKAGRIPLWRCWSGAGFRHDSAGKRARHRCGMRSAAAAEPPCHSRKFFCRTAHGV
jgi:hypothetical protein